MSNRISKQNCSVCHTPLSTESLTVDEVRAKYPNGFHPQCKIITDNVTDSVVGQLLMNVKSTLTGAKNRGIEWKLGSVDEAFFEIYTLYEKQQGCCALSGIPFIFNGSEKWEFNFKPSIDRIDSDRGYELGNIQLVLVCLNYQKGNMPQSELVRICEAVVANQSSTITVQTA